MTQWRTFPLGAAIELAYGKSLPKGSRVESGSIPVYGSNGITGWHDTAVVNGPTVIVGRKGSAGAVQFVDGPCFPIDTTYYARPREGFDFDIKFLFYLLRQLDLSRLKTATGVPGLTREDAYRETIPVPPLPEQRRIVDLLSRAEGIVRLRREAEKKAAELIPALFLNMFGDPATNPKGWPVAKIGTVTSVQTGATPSRDNPAYYLDAGIPWVKTGEVSGDVIFDTEEKISRAALAKTNCKVFPVDTILVAMYGQGQTRGRCAVLGIPAASNQACAAILPSDNISVAYLFCFLKTQYEQLRGMAHGGNQANLNLSMIKGLPFILPPLSAQRAFAEKLESISSIQIQQSTATAKAQATFDALLASVFNDRGGN
jgi:type I restriction enzyme S subunit